jgi:hypothetical protein
MTWCLQDFQNDMSSKQPDVDRLIKADKRRTSETPTSLIPVPRASTPRGAGTLRSRIPSRITSTNGRSTPDRFGRTTPEHFGRRTPDSYSGRVTPDYGSSGRRTPEPQFHNPRVGALFNKWRGVWLMAMERQRRLQDALDNLNEVREAWSMTSVLQSNLVIAPILGNEKETRIVCRNVLFRGTYHWDMQGLHAVWNCLEMSGIFKCHFQTFYNSDKVVVLKCLEF